MAKVKIPGILRKYTGENKIIIIDGQNVGQIMQSLARQYPQTNDLLYEDGKLQKFVSIYIGDDDVYDLDGMDTAVSDRTTIRIILPIVGG